MSDQVIERDVCIVGAGFAGLYAAKTLLEANSTVVVLEARTRVGGRTWTEYPDNIWLDKGGQWVGTEETGQVYLPRLIRQLGIGTYESFHSGIGRVRDINPPYDYVQVPEGKKWTDLQPFEDVKNALDEMTEMMEEIDPERPWLCPKAQEWDQQTFAAWMDIHVEKPKVKEILEANITYPCADPGDISMLALLALIKQCGGFDSLDISAQATRVIGGMQPVATAFAKSFAAGTVLEDEEVTDIRSEGGYCYITGKRTTVRARRVIVSTPPVLQKNIRFTPALSDDRRGVVDAWPQGCVIKIAMIYPSPFWRPTQYGGVSIYSGDTLDYTTFAVETADSSTTRAVSTRGVMVGFVYARKARELMSKYPDIKDRERIIFEEMVRRFGDERARHGEYEETYWTDERFTQGCYGAYLRPGATFRFKDAIRRPDGLIHWAGSETHWIWPTFIEGALRSGERAAGEVLRSLGG